MRTLLVILAHFAVPAARAADLSTFDCAGLLPEATRVAHGFGSSILASPGPRMLTCTAAGPSATPSVDVDCAISADLGAFTIGAWSAKKEHPSWQDVPRLGRSAYGDGTEIRAFDDDADCTVTVKAASGDAVALAQEVLRTLTPALLHAGELVLSCDRLLPPSLRAAALPGRTLRAVSTVPGQVECKFEAPSQPGQPPDVIGIDYVCGPTVPVVDPDAAAASLHAERVEVGAGGVLSLNGAFALLSFRDDDAPCQVNVDSPSGGREATVALAREVERALTAAALAP